MLYLWGNGSSLSSGIVAWAFHDGTDGGGPGLPDGDPPYANGRSRHSATDGSCSRAPSSSRRPRGLEHTNSYLEHEFVFERRIEV